MVFATVCGEPWQVAQTGPGAPVSSRSHLAWIDLPKKASASGAWQLVQAR